MANLRRQIAQQPITLRAWDTRATDGLRFDHSGFLLFVRELHSVGSSSFVRLVHHLPLERVHVRRAAAVTVSVHEGQRGWGTAAAAAFRRVARFLLQLRRVWKSFRIEVGLGARARNHQVGRGGVDVASSLGAGQGIGLLGRGSGGRGRGGQQLWRSPGRVDGLWHRRR